MSEQVDRLKVILCNLRKLPASYHFNVFATLNQNDIDFLTYNEVKDLSADTIKHWAETGAFKREALTCGCDDAARGCFSRMDWNTGALLGLKWGEVKDASYLVQTGVASAGKYHRELIGIKPHISVLIQIMNNNPSLFEEVGYQALKYCPTILMSSGLFSREMLNDEDIHFTSENMMELMRSPNFNGEDVPYWRVKDMSSSVKRILMDKGVLMERFIYDRVKDLAVTAATHEEFNTELLDADLYAFAKGAKILDKRVVKAVDARLDSDMSANSNMEL